MSKLTTETRDSLSDEDFAVPGKRRLPIHDEKHTRMAWDMVSKTKDLTPAERKEARRRIIERAHKFGIDTADWDEKRLNASALFAVASLDIATDDGHVNKMPFEGVLTRIGEPSDAPPEGSGGKRIIISMEAARKALPTIPGMAVDYLPSQDGHAPRRKIGVFTDADIVGNGIYVKGFVWKADFPDAAAEIKANKSKLGMSYEARNLYVVDPDVDDVVVTDCTFTGAAILLKDKAAYRSTSISASAEKGKSSMDEETKKAIEALTAGLGEFKTQLASVTAAMAKLPDTVKANANTRALVEPHAAALEAAASAMDAAGVGGHPERGHAVFARKMAGHLRAAGALGKVPNIFTDHDFLHAAAETRIEGPDLTKQIGDLLKPLTDKLAGFETQLADVKAAAAKAATAPERKTLPAAITQLLAKANVEPDKGTGKIAIGTVDSILKDVKEPGDRLKIKATMKQCGLID